MRQAAISYGYAPNDHARSLATGTSSTIGCVIPISQRNEILNPIYSDFLAGVGTICAREGFEIILKVVENDSLEEAYRTMKSKSNIGGVILQSPTMNDARLELLDKIGLPFVVHGRSSGYDKPYSWLDVNNARAIARATDLLSDLGHRCIGLINGPGFLDFATRRKSGFLHALDNAGLAQNDDYIIESEMTALHGYQSMRILLGMDPAPTAVVVSSTVVAWGVKETVEEAGLQLGKDISAVCFDDEISFIGNTAAMPIFSAGRPSIRGAGAEVVRTLISHIKSGDFTPTQKLLEADLIIGRSTGACKTAPQTAG